jgi:hypothetical protein
MITIPVEDAFYGYSLFMLNVYFFNRSKKKVVAYDEGHNLVGNKARRIAKAPH